MENKNFLVQKKLLYPLNYGKQLVIFKLIYLRVHLPFLAQNQWRLYEHGLPCT